MLFTARMLAVGARAAVAVVGLDVIEDSVARLMDEGEDEARPVWRSRLELRQGFASQFRG